MGDERLSLWLQKSRAELWGQGGERHPHCPRVLQSPPNPIPSFVHSLGGEAPGLPSGSPAMTLITQVSGSAGGGEAPGLHSHGTLGRPPEALPRPL